MLRWRDFLDYVNEADRDNKGMHYPFEKNSSTWFHIYNGRSTVNVALWKDTHMQVVFNGTGVTVYPVKAEIADFSDGVRMIIDDPIDNGIHEWEMKVRDGGAVKETLRDAIGTWKQKKFYEREERYKKLSEFTRNIVDKMEKINQNVVRLKSISMEYNRYTGDLFSVDAATERAIEEICNELLNVSGELLEPHNFRWICDNLPDQIWNLSKIIGAVEKELKNVDNAKKFLERYHMA